MKGTHLGEFQEVVMLSILILEDDAYGVTIQEEIHRSMERRVSRGALQTALNRLEDKGFVTSAYGTPTATRGGRKKRYYQVSGKGLEVLQRAKELKQKMWTLATKLT